jgi:hypothetical protein
MPASELPDYRPPFGSGAVRADMDGNLWIRTIPGKFPPFHHSDSAFSRQRIASDLARLLRPDPRADCFLRP